MPLNYLPTKLVEDVGNWTFHSTVQDAMKGITDAGADLMRPISQHVDDLMQQTLAPHFAARPEPAPPPPQVPDVKPFSIGTPEDWLGATETETPRNPAAAQPRTNRDPVMVRPAGGSWQVPFQLPGVEEWLGPSSRPPAPTAAASGAPVPVGGAAAPAPGGPLANFTIDRSSQQAFLGSFAPAAAAALRAKGLPASLAPILAAIPVNEQGWQKDAPGNNYFGIKGCFDATTEVLTGDGWKRWPAVTAADLLACPNPYTGAVDYEHPTHLIKYRHTGLMYRVVSDDADLLVTPEHRLWVRPSGGCLFHLVPAHDVAGRGYQSLAVHAVPLHGRIARIELQPVPSLGSHIGHVVGLRAKAQMLWAHARRVVTAVHHLLVGRQRDTVGQLVRHPMGAVHAAQFADLAVAPGVPGGDPDPARAKVGGVRGDRAVLVDLGPQSLLARAKDLAPAGAATAARVAQVDLPGVGQEVSSADLADARDGTFLGHRSHSFGVTAPARSNGRGALVRSNYTPLEGWVQFSGMVYCASVPNGLLIVRRGGKVVVSGNSNPRTGANTGPVNTWEDYGGGRTNIQDTFRAYDSPAESVQDFLQFLEDNPRYAPALKVARETGDPAAFIKAVHAAGYATDPVWSDKILNIAKQVPAVAEPTVASLQAPSVGGVGPPPTGANTPAWGTYTPETLTPNQLNEGLAQGLSRAEALAICGPAAAVAFARANNRNPTLKEAKELGTQLGVWSEGQGMAGPASEVALLQKMGVPARLQQGADWGAIAQEVQAGRPVILDSPGHYWTVTAFDPKTGQFEFGQSAGVLTAARGRTKFRPEEIPSLGMGDIRATILMGAAPR